MAQEETGTVNKVRGNISSRSVRRVACELVGLGALAVMAAQPMARADEQIPPAATKEAEEIYKSRCSLCHGPTGKGDGPAGAALNPKPRDLGDPAWQKSVTDEHIEKIILGGGSAVGKSPLMPGNPDLASKPDVIKALRAMVRGFGKSK
jgi:mono/diheme cytochrome c family protein